jgi:D-glycero-D-manno-heptose 1,7-bisphosphate phosphatase
VGVGDLNELSAASAAVFLDRDGTLNRAYLRNGVSYPPMSVEQLAILPGVPDGLAALKQVGFLLIVVTNQPDVARGALSLEVANDINAALRRSLPVIDALYSCFHDDGDGCACRKPKPGMLLDAARMHALELTRSYMVGDSWKDTVAGQAAGCATVQLRSEASRPHDASEPAVWVDTLGQATDWILAIERQVFRRA